MLSITRSLSSLVLAVAFSAVAHAGQFTVEAGKTKPLKLKAEADSVVIGNPNVADVAVHDSKLLFISGKSFGTTNLIVFDKNAKTLFSADIVVTTNSANLVTVNRAGSNFTYDCAPECRPSPAIGDNEDHFGRVIGQMDQQKGLSE